MTDIKVAFVIDEEGRVKLIPLDVPVETLSGGRASGKSLPSSAW